MAQSSSQIRSARIAFWVGAGLLAVSLIFLAVTRIRQTIPADFALPTLDSDTIRLSDYRGRIVVLNFWASWCLPCADEMPDLQKFYLAHRGEGVAVIGINVGESAETARAFAQQAGVTFPIALDSNTSVAVRYEMRGLPMTFVIDRFGLIRWRHLGRVTPELLEAQVR